MLVTNLVDIKGKNYEIIGLVEGTTVYAKHFGKDFMAGFKNIVGGEIKSYTEMIVDAKNQAKERLINEAKSLNADAILNLNYSITNMQTGSALVVLSTGTAIKFV